MLLHALRDVVLGTLDKTRHTVGSLAGIISLDLTDQQLVLE